MRLDRPSAVRTNNLSTAMAMARGAPKERAGVVQSFARVRVSRGVFHRAPVVAPSIVLLYPRVLSVALRRTFHLRVERPRRSPFSPSAADAGATSTLSMNARKRPAYASGG